MLKLFFHLHIYRYTHSVTISAQNRLFICDFLFSKTVDTNIELLSSYASFPFTRDVSSVPLMCDPFFEQ